MISLAQIAGSRGKIEGLTEMRPKSVVVVAACSVGLASAAALYGYKRWKQSECEKSWELRFEHSSKGPLAPSLDPGKYRIEVSATGYTAECDIEVGTEAPDLQPQCRGDGLRPIWRSEALVGFLVMNEPAAASVRILRNGLPFREGMLLPFRDTTDFEHTSACIQYSATLTL